MITNGTEYLKAINDIIALNMAADETRGALASLCHAPQTATVEHVRELFRAGLLGVEHEAARIEAECKAWQGSEAAAREAMNDISLGMAFPERGRDMEKVA